MFYILLYIKSKNFKSVLHLNNLKYCDAQAQICSLNSRLEHNINHNAITGEVQTLVDEDINHNLIQQSLLDAIRCLNLKMPCTTMLNNFNYSTNTIQSLTGFQV